MTIKCCTTMNALKTSSCCNFDKSLLIVEALQPVRSINSWSDKNLFLSSCKIKLCRFQKSSLTLLYNFYYSVYAYIFQSKLSKRSKRSKTEKINRVFTMYIIAHSANTLMLSNTCCLCLCNCN